MISTLSAIVVAVLTGYVTYTVTVIERDTKLTLAEAENDINRAQLFRSLIAELQEDDTANLAILVLWSMYPSERHQRMILMAALQANSTKAAETLISLDEELKPHYD